MHKRKQLPDSQELRVEDAAPTKSANFSGGVNQTDMAHQIAAKIEESLRDVRSGREHDHEEVFKEFDE